MYVILVHKLLLKMNKYDQKVELFGYHEHVSNRGFLGYMAKLTEGLHCLMSNLVQRN